MSQLLAPCAEHKQPTKGLHPSSGSPRVSLKLPAQKAPHGRELGFQQAEEVSSLHSILLCLETPSKRQRMDLLSCHETVMGGSPELLFTQPPTDAIRKEAAAPPICLLFLVNTLFGDQGHPQPHLGVPTAFREPSAFSGPPCSQPECLGAESASGAEQEGDSQEGSSRRRQGAILESGCPGAQFCEIHTLPLC